MATNDGRSHSSDIGERLAEEKQAYAGDEERPLEGYVAAMATFGAVAVSDQLQPVYAQQQQAAE